MEGWYWDLSVCLHLASFKSLQLNYTKYVNNVIKRCISLLVLTFQHIRWHTLDLKYFTNVIGREVETEIFLDWQTRDFAQWENLFLPVPGGGASASIARLAFSNVLEQDQTGHLKNYLAPTRLHQFKDYWQNIVIPPEKCLKTLNSSSATSHIPA